MPDDLVAQLTLQLRDDITEGLRPLENTLSGLDDSVQALRETLTGLNETIASLHAPTALSDGLAAAKGAAAEAAGGLDDVSAAAKATAGEVTVLADDLKALQMPSDAAAGVAAIGAAADTSAGKVEALANEVKSIQVPLGWQFHDRSNASGPVPDAGSDAAPDDDQIAMPDNLTRYSAERPGISTIYGDDGLGYGGEPSSRRRKRSWSGDDDEGDDDDSDRGSSRDGHGGFGPHAPGHAIDWLGTGLAAYLGLDAVSADANFQNLALHAAITEKLSGQDAQAEASRIQGTLQPIALQTATPSEDLAEAYYFLITTGMNKDLINRMMPALATTSTAYNVPVSQMTNAAFTLNENLGIGAQDMGPALAMLAYAAKLGHFTLADFGEGLPEIGGQLNKLGMRGSGSEDVAASALEILRRNTGQSGEAATQLQDLVMYLTSPMGTRMFDMTKRSRDLMSEGVRHIFDKYHIAPLDIPTYLNNERKQGVDPLDAMVDYFHKILGPITSPTDRAFVVGGLMHNQAAQQAMLSLVQYYNDFQKDKADLGKVNPDVVSTDFGTAMGGAIVQVRLFHEEMEQLERDLGQGLLPLLTGVNDIAKPFLGAIDALNHDFSIMGTGLGSLNLAIGASYFAFRALTSGIGAISGIFSRLAGTGAGAAAGAGEAAAEAGGAAAAGAGFAGAVGTAGGVLVAEAIAAEALLIHREQVNALNRNTDALDKNSESKSTTSVVRPDGTVQTIGPGGVGNFAGPHLAARPGARMSGPLSTNGPAGQVLGRP